MTTDEMTAPCAPPSPCQAPRWRHRACVAWEGDARLVDGDMWVRGQWRGAGEGGQGGGGARRCCREVHGPVGLSPLLAATRDGWRQATSAAICRQATAAGNTRTCGTSRVGAANRLLLLTVSCLSLCQVFTRDKIFSGPCAMSVG